MYDDMPNYEPTRRRRARFGQADWTRSASAKRRSQTLRMERERKGR